MTSQRRVGGGGHDHGEPAEAEQQERAVAPREVPYGAVRQGPSPHDSATRWWSRGGGPAPGAPTGKEEDFATRPISRTARLCIPDGAEGIIFEPYGDAWRQIRKVCTVALLNSMGRRRLPNSTVASHPLLPARE